MCCLSFGVWHVLKSEIRSKPKTGLQVEFKQNKGITFSVRHISTFSSKHFSCSGFQIRLRMSFFL